MILSIFQGRFLLMRILMLTAAALLVCASILTIYAIGHPASDFSHPPSAISPDENSVGTAHPTRSQASGPRPQVPLTNKYSEKWQKQLLYAGTGLVCLVLVNLFDYRHLGPKSYLLYGIILALLAVLLVDKVIDLPFVPTINNSRRWIKLGFGFMIQPSEFCKIAFILALAWYLRFRSNYRTFKGLIGPFALTLLAMGLILLEPDLGTTVLLMPVLFCMLFVAGAKVRHLVVILCMGLAISPVVVSGRSAARPVSGPRNSLQVSKSLTG